MRSNSVLSLILLLTLNIQACAFKESPKESTNTTPDKPVVNTHPSAKKQGFVFISATERGPSFGEYKREFEVDLDQKGVSIPIPISLPEKVPNEISIKIASTAWKERSLAKIIATAKVNSEGAGGTELTVSDLNTIAAGDNQEVGWTAKVSGLNKFLSDKEEGIQYLQLELYEKGKGDAAEILTVSLMTPPSKIGAEQVSAEVYGGRVGAAINEYKVYQTTAFRLDLLQVIGLTNGSSLPVIINEAVKISGKLNSSFRKLAVNQAMCGYSITPSEWIDELATDFYLLPLDAEVSKDATVFINKTLKTGTWEIKLEPGATRVIGIYAQGAGVVKLVSGQYSIQSLKPTQVVSNCKSRCQHLNQVYFSPYWAKLNWPGASRHCVYPELCSASIGAWTPRIKDAECNMCMEWDLAENPWKDVHDIPHGEFYKVYCLGGPPSRGWIIEKFQETILTGTANDPVMLRLPVESALIHARFDLQQPNERTQERAMSGLIQQEVVQMK